MVFCGRLASLSNSSWPRADRADASAGVRMAANSCRSAPAMKPDFLALLTKRTLQVSSAATWSRAASKSARK
jgi:hypothetical protein